MVVLSGAVANSSFNDLQPRWLSPDIFQSNAVQFTANDIAARKAEKFAEKSDRLSREFEKGQQKRELDAMKERALIAAGRPAGRAERFALLLQSGALEPLAKAFQPQAALGANLVKQYETMALNRPDPLQVAEQTLTRANNFQQLIDGLGPKVVAPFMARGLNDYYSGIDPFSNSLPNPTQGFL